MEGATGRRRAATPLGLPRCSGCAEGRLGGQRGVGAEGEGPRGPGAPGGGKKKSTPVCCCAKPEVIRLHPSTPTCPAFLIQKAL